MQLYISNETEYINIEGGCGTCVASILKRRVVVVTYTDLYRM